MKFQLADQIAAAYRHLYRELSDHDAQIHVSRDLGNLAGVNGLCEDLRDGYSYLGSRYSDIWLRENRLYWLANVRARYDAAAALWVARSAKLAGARDAWYSSHALPAPADMGIPPAPAAP
jgi:hexosaminidase